MHLLILLNEYSESVFVLKNHFNVYAQVIFTVLVLTAKVTEEDMGMSNIWRLKRTT